MQACCSDIMVNSIGVWWSNVEESYGISLGNFHSIQSSNNRVEYKLKDKDLFLYRTPRYDWVVMIMPQIIFDF